MGKDLRGKELGVGISQLKDGRYTARFTNRRGERKQKYFKKLQDCRKWIADAQFNDDHGNIFAGGDMTVDAWFEYWIENIKGTVIKATTKRTITTKYKTAIQPYIGKMMLSEVKPLHCQDVLNRGREKYRPGTNKKTRTVMHELFSDALENDLIHINPVTNSVKSNTVQEEKGKNVLSELEQKILVGSLGNASWDNAIRFILQTGMRIGEVSGLKWGDIDFERRVLSVSRSTSLQPQIGWVTNEPKTKSGYRTIPLTEEAVNILLSQKKLDSQLNKISFEFRDNVFLGKRGNPLITTNGNAYLKKKCEEVEIPRISLHCLRHTFATRCIEHGMTPKILQGILGHASISMTMDCYVHPTEDAKISEMRAIEKCLKVV